MQPVARVDGDAAVARRRPRPGGSAPARPPRASRRAPPAALARPRAGRAAAARRPARRPTGSRPRRRPARAQGTIGPTANQCDWTATPSSPVAGSRATIEYVPRRMPAYLPVAVRRPPDSRPTAPAPCSPASRAMPAGLRRRLRRPAPGAPRFAGHRAAGERRPAIPWHRVVRADGSLTQGERQAQLLEAEGVPFTRRPRATSTSRLARWCGDVDPA